MTVVWSPQEPGRRAMEAGTRYAYGNRPRPNSWNSLHEGKDAVSDAETRASDVCLGPRSSGRLCRSPLFDPPAKSAWRQEIPGVPGDGVHGDGGHEERERVLVGEPEP